MDTRQKVLWLAMTVMIIALDQWTKMLASTQLSYGLPVEILPVFNLTLQHNTGAAFSFLADAGGWQRWFFTAVSALVSVVILVWLWRLKAPEKLLAASLAFILGGAVGNLWDRIEQGYVVDFISVHYQSWYFPAFNIADSAITIGAGLMILDMLLNPDKGQSSNPDRGQSSAK
jgi:signal peptidase II